jgi:membrane protease YdiL (CAAX protease family)
VVGITFCSILFSIGHGYQGITGMMENALFGVTLGITFVLAKKNLWYPILIHGFVDTIGFCLILSGLYP